MNQNNQQPGSAFDRLHAAAEACDDAGLTLNAADLREIASSLAPSPQIAEDLPKPLRAVLVSVGGRTFHETAAENYYSESQLRAIAASRRAAAEPMYQIYDPARDAWDTYVKEDYDNTPDDARRIVYAAPPSSLPDVAMPEPIGEVVKGAAHLGMGWHVQVYKPWDEIGAGTKLYLATPAEGSAQVAKHPPRVTPDMLKAQSDALDQLEEIADRREAMARRLGISTPAAVVRAAPAMPTDEQIVAALHACGIDTHPSKYGFDALQVDATSVPTLRNVLAKLFPAAEGATQAGELTDAARDVLAERRRQVEQEGWLPDQDDQYDAGELALAASCYALAGNGPHVSFPEDWPWDRSWWKPTGDRRNTVKAAALLLAEIERQDRARIDGDKHGEQGGGDE